MSDNEEMWKNTLEKERTEMKIKLAHEVENYGRERQKIVDQLKTGNNIMNVIM